MKNIHNRFKYLKKTKCNANVQFIGAPFLAAFASACTTIADNSNDAAGTVTEDKAIEIAQGKGVSLEASARYEDFEESDFGYRSKNEEDTFGGLMLVSSGAGALYLADGTEIAVGDSIRSADIAGMYWVPSGSANSDTEIEFKVFSEGKESDPSTDSFSYKVSVTAVDNMPVITTTSKTVTLDEDTRYESFEASDFGYQDADAYDTLGGLMLVSAGAGTLYLADGTEIRVGETINIADIADMYWVPNENANDDTVIEFKVFSEGKESKLSAETFSYNISINAVDDAPIMQDVSKEVALDEDTSYLSFNGFDFTYQDIDYDDRFGGLILVSSGAGVLYFAGGTAVAVGAIINAIDIADMYWVPTKNANSDTKIEFKVFSKGKESNPSAEIFSYNMNMNSIDDMPGRLSTDTETVIRGDKNLKQREEATFSVSDFSAFWSDPDTEDTFGGIYITTHNAESGKWFLDGAEITTPNFKVLKSDLDKLTFIADEDFIGQATVDFKVFSEGKENNLSLNNRIQFDVSYNVPLIDPATPLAVPFTSFADPYEASDQIYFENIPGRGSTDVLIDGNTYTLTGFSTSTLVTDFSSSIKYKTADFFLTIVLSPTGDFIHALTDDIDGNGKDDIALYVIDDVAGNNMPIVHILWDFDFNFQSFGTPTSNTRSTLDLSIGAELAERGSVLSIMSDSPSNATWKDVYFKDMDGDGAKELFIVNDVSDDFANNSGIIYLQRNLSQYNQASPTEIAMYGGDYSAISSDNDDERLGRHLFATHDIDENGKVDVVTFSKAVNPSGTSVGALHVIWDMLDTNEGFLYRDAADLNFTPHFTVYGIDDFDDLAAWNAQLYALEGDDKFNDLLFTVGEGGSGNNLLNNAGYIGLVWDINQYSSNSYDFIDLANIGSNSASALIISGGHESDKFGSSKVRVMDFEGSQGPIASMIVGAELVDNGAIADVGGYYFIWDVNSNDYKVAGGYHIDLANPHNDDRVLHILGKDNKSLLDAEEKIHDLAVSDIDGNGNLDVIIHQNSTYSDLLPAAMYIAWDVVQHSRNYKVIDLQDLANENVLKIFRSDENLTRDIIFSTIEQIDIDLDGHLDLFFSDSTNKSFIVWGGGLEEMQEIDLTTASNVTKIFGNYEGILDTMLANYIFDDIAMPDHPKDERRDIILRTAEPAGSAHEGMHGVNYGTVDFFDEVTFSYDAYVDIG